MQSYFWGGKVQLLAHWTCNQWIASLCKDPHCYFDQETLP